jgi:hypothetical protein
LPLVQKIGPFANKMINAGLETTAENPRINGKEPALAFDRTPYSIELPLTSGL